MNKYIKISCLALMILVVIGAYLFMQSFSISNDATEEDNGEGIEEIDTSDWQMYRNEELGFEFMYPAEWGEVSHVGSQQLRLRPPEGSDLNFAVVIGLMYDHQSTGYTSQMTTSLTYDFECQLNLGVAVILNSGVEGVNLQGTQYLPGDDCFGIFEDIPSERIEVFNFEESHRVTRAYLEEYEIPEVAQEQHQNFTIFIESFKSL